MCACAQICINNLAACLHHCPGAGTFAYRAVIGLPRVPLPAAERMNSELKSHMCVLCEVREVLTMKTYTRKPMSNGEVIDSDKDELIDK